MAELDVQPKKNNPWWLWLLLLLVALALLFFFLRGCNNKKVNQTGVDSTAANGADKTQAVAATTTSAIDFNSPKASYEEITDTSISVRGNTNYTIYGLGEDILFDKDNSTLKSTAEAELKMIAGSLNKRFKGAELSVYGRTDATGTTDHNKQLGAARAETVRAWLVKNENLPDSAITIHSLGESNPVASNATAAGRRENRSVAIVATPKTGSK